MAELGIGVSLSSDEDYSSDQQTPYTGGSGGGGGGGSSSRRRTTPPYLEAGDAPPPSKKPRGRPPGSKNKPKPPVVITQDNDKSMKPVVMTIGAGNDVMDTIISFARRCNAGITVLSGSGSVSKVTLCNPFSHASPPFTLHGPFTLLALNGTFLNPPIPHSLAASSSSSSSSSSPNPASSFGISFSGAQGQIFGGVVGGKIVSGNNGVVLVTSLIKNPEVHRVTGVDEDDGDEGDNPNNQGGTAAGGSGAGVGGDSLFNPLMNSQVPSDANVLQWGQTAPRHPNY